MSAFWLIPIVVVSAILGGVIGIALFLQHAWNKFNGG